MNRKNSTIFTGISLGVMFVLMLILNILTPKMADDFAYSQSFATKELLTNVLDIFPSLFTHALRMNGRMVAHFFAQLFLMLPDGIFDVVNAAVFVGQVYLLYRIAIGCDKGRPLLLWGLFGAIWVFMPAFGQVNLWLDGSCNYLWCTAFGLLFLLPYIRAFMADRPLKSKTAQTLFVLLALLTGGFLENGSAAFFGMSVLFLILIRLVRKKTPKPYLIFGSVSAFLGYLSIYLAPAEWTNKSTSFTGSGLAENFTRAWEMYLNFIPLLIAFFLLLAMALCFRNNQKRICLSLVFLAGSLAANFMLTFASYYPERCASSALILLLAADAVLLQTLTRGAWRVLADIALTVVVILNLVCLAVGVPDIVRVRSEIAQNAQTIAEQKAQGVYDITLPLVHAETRFCGLYGLKYLGTEVPEDWPNVSMAIYYGIDTVIGQQGGTE